MIDYKAIIKNAVWICVLIAACRFTHSLAAPVLVLIAIAAAFSKRKSLPIWVCIALPFVVCISSYIIVDKLALVLSARIGYILIGLTLIVFNSSSMKNKAAPLGLLFAYCAFEIFPSALGYCPRVSYYKLVFFTLYIASLSAVAKCIVSDGRQIDNARHMLLALCAVLVIGSLCVIPFPAIAYPQTTRWLIKGGMDVASANKELTATLSTRGMVLFAGITLHSQMLGPLLATVVCFLLCDMLFILHKVTKFHAALLVLCLVFAYMTRSRTALFALGVGIVIIGFYTGRHIQMSARARNSMKVAMGIFTFAIIAGAIIGQMRSELLTKWLFKGETGKSSGMEAITSTRQGAIEEAKRDFFRNPVIGCGFQVNEDSARFNDQAFVLSAPVEKGLLPLVVIGEGGVVGTIIFAGFLMVFYSVCIRRRYFCTMTCFSTMLATNIGEATFFSPGGVGGLLWCFAIVGGGVLDATQKRIMTDVAIWRGFACAH